MSRDQKREKRRRREAVPEGRRNWRNGWSTPHRRTKEKESPEVASRRVFEAMRDVRDERRFKVS